MSKLVQYRDLAGCTAAVQLNNGDEVLVSLAVTASMRVTLQARTGDGFLRRLAGGVGIGAVLYYETDVQKNARVCSTLSDQFPEVAAELACIKNGALQVFVNAVWHCSSSGEASTVLNRALKAVALVREAGTTPENAIRIQAANSLEGIPKEYAVLSAMFGTVGKDWKIIDHRVIKASDGRDLERFIISANSNRRDIYFDISEWLHKNTDKETRALKTAITAYDERTGKNRRPLSVSLPREECFTLWGGVIRLTQNQRKQLGLSSDEHSAMLEAFGEAVKPYGRDYSRVPEHIRVIATRSVWRNALTLLAHWQPANFLQEEEFENLKTIIDGTMKNSR